MCWKGCLDLMFGHRMLEVANDLGEFMKVVKSKKVKPMKRVE